MSDLNFSTFVNLLYPYCGSETPAAFVVTATSNIMMASSDIENPLDDNTPDHRNHIFKGTKSMSKKTAATILSRIDKMRFGE